MIFLFFRLVQKIHVLEMDIMNTISLDIVNIPYRQLNYFPIYRPRIVYIYKISILGKIKNNGNFMVSIHRVPVIVYLIIRAISSLFRFKRGALHCRSLHVLRLLRIAHPAVFSYMKNYRRRTLQR